MLGYDATGVIAARAKKGLNATLSNTDIDRFADIYFENTPDREYGNLDDASMAAHLANAFEFFKNAKRDEINIRVFNPDWTTDYTVIEILMKDQSFIVDTLWTELSNLKLFIRHTIHPIFNTKRSDTDDLVDFASATDAAPEEGWQRASVVHVEVRRQTAPETLENIEKNVREALTLAQRAAGDFLLMTGKLSNIIAEKEATIEPTAINQELMAFMEWLLYRNFIFLGYRHYDLEWISKDDATMSATHGSGLGIMSIDKESTTFKPKKLSELPPNMQNYMSSDELITITKTLNKSRVHRPADLDYIGIKDFDDKGRVIGEHRFTGLFTSKAYTTSARDIPVVGYKIEQVLRKAAKAGTKHYNYKSLVNILSTYPIDELLQISVEDLTRISQGILHLQERPQVRLFTRDNYRERLVSALLYVPRDRMSSDLRAKAIEILTEAYDAEDVEWNVSLSESRLAQLFFKIRTREAKPIHVDDDEVGKRIDDATRPWSEDLYFNLIENHGEIEGTRLFKRYNTAFQAGYCEHTPIDTTLADISVLESMAKEKNDLDVMIMPKNSDLASYDYRLKLFHVDTQINLSEIMPMFDQMGLFITTEHPSRIRYADDQIVWLHDFGIKLPDGAKLDEKAAELLKQAVQLSWKGELESDKLNGLILNGLSIAQIVVLRSLAAYVHQISSNYSNEYVQETLVKHPELAQILADIFDARFSLDLSNAESDKKVAKLQRKLQAGLKNVAVLDEDRILQRIHDVIMATLRTNAFQRVSGTDPLALKIKPTEIPNMVKPIPMFEIFVYHTRVEGIHLRGGAVARGGLRWSDRPADFRTEVLGLMKAQMVKNTIIVPSGSKGGFVLKTPPCDIKNIQSCDRNELMKAVQNSYSIFINSLLSVTDNLVMDKVIAPRDVKRHDGDDPYLVVAADKGTATFSDLANNIAESADYWPKQKNQKKSGFWLGDAFASGGSNGYDHKKMGITARGAWECVKHNFRLIDHDIQTEPFTCVGIGDMAGDVFGNGMLLSKQIKLLAAFNHLHIFVDPNPDPATSWKERNRMFKLQHSSWEDYDAKLISKGGGVFSRSDKSIQISSEMKKAFDIKEDELSPNDLIRHILKSEIDLLWNGGIGTFVKAENETHQEVSDRANDEIRINGSELRAKVAGEGGNLGFTQLGRIEYAQNGGCMNTDSIDNSAGVDTSDHEVNIKILLAKALEKGDLSEDDRNQLLADMTDEVADLVLVDNYLQAQAITLKHRNGVNAIDVNMRLINHLAAQGLLDPAIEFLPNQEEMEKRRQQGKGFTRPELSVLIGYAKDQLYRELMESNLVDVENTKSMARYLVDYFPSMMREKYKKLIMVHPLRREIIGTAISNEVINRMGLTFLDRMHEETGRSPATVARSFIISKRLYRGDDWWHEIEGLDNKVPSAVQMQLHETVKKVIEYGAFWVLRNCEMPLGIDREEQRLSQAFAEVINCLNNNPHVKENKRRLKRVEKWGKEGLDKKLAEKYSYVPQYLVAPDLAAIYLTYKESLDAETITNAYFKVGAALHLESLRIQIRGLKTENNWKRVALQTSIDDLYSYQKAIAHEVLSLIDKDRDIDKAMKLWQTRNKNAMSRYRSLLDEVLTQPSMTHDMIVVVKGQLRSLFSPGFEMK